MRIPAHSVCTAIRDDIVAGVYERGSRLHRGTAGAPVRRLARPCSRSPAHAGGRGLRGDPAARGRVRRGTHRAGGLRPAGDAHAPGTAGRLPGRPTADRGTPQGAARPGQAGSGTGQEGQQRGSALPGGWFHETLAQSSGSHALASTLTQLRHKIAWMYSVEALTSPVDSWAEHGAIVDAVARGDSERARAITALHTERATAAHRLRFPGGGDRPDRVRTSQHPVNMTGLRH